MSDQELVDLFEEFVVWYGKPYPDPDHCPNELRYLIKMFLYYRTTNE